MKYPTLLYIFLFFIHGIKAQSSRVQSSIDFKTADVILKIDSAKKLVTGVVTYTFEVTENVDSFFIDAKKMVFSNVLLDGKKILTKNDKQKLWLHHTFKKGTSHTIEITYTAYPQKAMYFIKDYQGKDQIWTQGQGKYSSNWLPSFDDMNEKIIFDLTMSYDKEYKVIANGKLKNKTTKGNLNIWEYDMEAPMSSYLLAIVIGNYDKKVETSVSGIPLEFYYYPQDKEKVEPTYRHSKQIFDFLEEEIGVRYPWQNYKQIPVKDFLYAGMENTGTTIFSDAFVVDSIAYKDRNYINVNAHELAHQWFGDLITETEGKHHWLQEGFATYYALLAEREIFGEDYFYYKLYESAEQLMAISQKNKGTALLDAKASSLTFYQRGAWTLFALRKKIGDDNFKIAIHNYLENYKFQNVTTSDFIKTVEKVSKIDLKAFQKTWLEDVKFPSEEALELLKESDFIKKYLTLAQERTQPLIGKWRALAGALRFPANDYLGQEAVYQLEGNTSKEAIALYSKAFDSNNPFILQTIATIMNKIPNDLKNEYQSILETPSYAAIEPALYHLWTNYPKERNSYLEKTKEIIGFNDKNVRILWLVLALNTPDYEKEKHRQFFAELSGYTSINYGFNTRENAFTYLESLQAFNDESLKNLLAGSVHHNWRFRNNCRAILDRLIKDETYQKRFRMLENDLPSKEQQLLRKKLNI